MSAEIYVSEHDIYRAQDRIARGVPREECCPVALALQHAGYEGAKVLDGGIEWKGIIYASPEGVDEFVRDFDDGKRVSGLRFTFDDEEIAF